MHKALASVAPAGRHFTEESVDATLQHPAWRWQDRLEGMSLIGVMPTLSISLPCPMARTDKLQSRCHPSASWRSPLFALSATMV